MPRLSSAKLFERPCMIDKPIRRVWAFCDLCRKVGFTLYGRRLGTSCGQYEKFGCLGIVHPFDEKTQAMAETAYRLAGHAAARDLCMAIFEEENQPCDHATLQPREVLPIHMQVPPMQAQEDGEGRHSAPLEEGSKERSSK